MPPTDTILNRLAHLAATKPGQVIYTFVDDRGQDKDTLSCETLHKQSQLLARNLLGRGGLEVGDRAILCYPPSLDFVTAVLD